MSTEPTPVADDRVVRDANIKFGITKWDIWALGITIVIGGQYFSWNAGLTSGFGSYFVSTILMGTAYICLCLSVSEITSALPFAGGAYGLARCSLGFFPGFVIGCSETVEYIFYVSSSTVSLGQMFTTMFPDLIGYEPYIWLAFYLSALSIHIFGGKYFWRFTMIMAVASILPLMIFVFGSLKWSNIQKYGESTEDTPLFIGGISQFLTSFPLPAWFYVGVESLNMASNDIDQPKLTIPFGQITCILTLFCFSILVLSVASGLPPGLADLAGNPFPLNTGFSLIFNTDSRYLILLSIPATYATAFGFIYSYGKLMIAMANSKLLPSIFAVTHPTTGAPWVAITFGSFIGYSACLISYFFPHFTLRLFNICILAAFVSYSAQSVGYIFLQTQMSTLKREFRSPLGIYGAIYAWIIWTVGVISIMGFQNDHFFSVTFYICVLIMITIYYYTFAAKKQTLSEEERRIMFKVHVVNNNTAKKRKERHASNSKKKILRTDSSSERSNLSNFFTSSRKRSESAKSESISKTSKTPSSKFNGSEKTLYGLEEGEEEEECFQINQTLVDTNLPSIDNEATMDKYILVEADNIKITSSLMTKPQSSSFLVRNSARIVPLESISSNE